MNKKFRNAFLPSLILCGLMAGTTEAANITYNLASHPDGSVSPPPYGLRLDGLYTLDTNDEWTFDFDHASSNMQMTLDTTAATVHIFGNAYGGLDVGGSYDANLQGVWAIDFTYSVNVAVDDSSPPALEVEVSPEAPLSNNGTIEALFTANDGSIFVNNGDTINLEQEMQFYFNNTANHRLNCGVDDCGPDTYVGWGWLNHSDSSHIAASDWLFTATVVPVPAAVWLFGSAIALLGFSRRKTTS